MSATVIPVSRDHTPGAASTSATTAGTAACTIGHSRAAR
jgi:hypothetical protein